jgi:uncharacterized protein YjiS (DUF1127 family)
MKILRLAAASSGDTKTGHSFNHHLLQRPEAGFIAKIIVAVKNKIEAYKAEARRERETEQVLQMSDSMLRDIGLTHTDRQDLETGLTSLVDLNARRETYRRQFD